MSLLQHKENIHSQNGEDGVLREIFHRMDIKNGTFFEFGAADGMWMSNTWYLLEKKNWRGLYVEAGPKYTTLVQNCLPFSDRIKYVNAFVEPTGDNTIERLWERAFPNNTPLDFLSIDIDGNDDELLESLIHLQPKVIMIEVNAGHHPEYPRRIPNNIASNNVGQSMYQMLTLSKGRYFPVAYTGNLILIHRDHSDKFTDINKDLVKLYIDFLRHLDLQALVHLKKTFISSDGWYNNFRFINPILEDYIGNIRV